MIFGKSLRARFDWHQQFHDDLLGGAPLANSRGGMRHNDHIHAKRHVAKMSHPNQVKAGFERRSGRRL